MRPTWALDPSAFEERLNASLLLILCKIILYLSLKIAVLESALAKRDPLKSNDL